VTLPGTPGELIWEDNFSTFDAQRWVVEHSTYGDGNNELQCYRPDNVSVVDGRLVLRAVTETYTCPNGSTRSVTSGMVRSRGLTFSPGQALEFRVKLTPADESDQSGLWPAVWSSGWGGGGWPTGGELDFLEVMTANDPTRSIYSIHFAEPDGSHGVVNRPIFGAQDFSAQWHTVRFDYGLDGHLVWYLDGREVFEVTSAQTRQGYPAPFNLPIREIKINLALGGRPGPLSPNAVGTVGARFEVDFIRIYRL
jgi:beta-glucanase (GH16 family)